MQGWTLKVRCPRKALKKGPYILHMLYRNFICWHHSKFFIFSENLLLRESTFYIVNCLKSFGFKLFFVYIFKLLRGPFRHICTKFCFIITNIWLASELIKRGSGVINKLFNKPMQKLSAKLSIGGPHGISERGCAGRPPCLYPLISAPDYVPFTNVGNDLRTYLSLIVTNHSGERSYSKIKVIEWTKEHH